MATFPTIYNLRLKSNSVYFATKLTQASLTLSRDFPRYQRLFTCTKKLFKIATTSQDATVPNTDDVQMVWDELNEIELDNLNDISDSEEKVFAYDEAGDPVDLEPNSRKVISKAPLIKKSGKTR